MDRSNLGLQTNNIGARLNRCRLCRRGDAAALHAHDGRGPDARDCNGAHAAFGMNAQLEQFLLSPAVCISLLIITQRCRPLALQARDQQLRNQVQVFALLLFQRLQCRQCGSMLAGLSLADCCHDVAMRTGGAFQPFVLWRHTPTSFPLSPRGRSLAAMCWPFVSSVHRSCHPDENLLSRF